MLFAVVITATIGLAFIGGVAEGGSIAKTPAGGTSATQKLSIEGVATISLIAPGGRILGVWSTHNSLVPDGIFEIAACISAAQVTMTTTTTTTYSGDQICPGSTSPWPNSYSAPVPSFTSLIGVSMGSCSYANGDMTNTVQQPGCETFSTSTNVLTTSGCPTSEPCGWVASATFTPAGLGCSETCTLNDVTAGAQQALLSPATVAGYVAFDDICSPSSAGCVSPFNNLPTITLSTGDSLAVSIQFTVS